jgi:hypothetical protein
MAPAMADAGLVHGRAIEVQDASSARSHAIIRTGLAVKAPQFYEFYTGRSDPGLDARMATARAARGTLTLSGVMQGPINTSPASEDLESYYVFGINRGSSSAVAPFPGRPNIVFDAVVTVSVETEGISASVTDLTRPRGQGTTDLPASSVHIRGNRVTVSLPLSDLTATAASPVNRWGVNLWPRSELPPADFHSVASFVPENALFPIAVAGRGATGR